MFSRKYARNRVGSFVLAVGYLLTVTVSGSFHDHHHGQDGPSSPRPGVSASHGEPHSECSVCQFLAQKPAPAAVVAVVDAGRLVQTVVPSLPCRLSSGVFSAWQSRAPPPAV
ncbi:MAG: hypothetical protein LLF97_05725 [Planctomycetaceae bacterium]|nr:hypothetical protein [Planctomycetaceae bacterium]